MNTTGIVICLSDSKNLRTVHHRIKDLITSNLSIQLETRHPVSSTKGCYNAHVKALKSAINYMLEYTIDYIIIAEEDILVDTLNKNYPNILKCLNLYDKDSDYILHLGGFPTFTNNLVDIYDNFFSRSTIKSNIYLTTCYVVNYDIATRLLNVLEKSSNHIHCDGIFANCNIKQELVKGNIVNQISDYDSDNTCVHRYTSTKNITSLFTVLNKFSILFYCSEYTLVFFCILTLFIKLELISTLIFISLELMYLIIIYCKKLFVYKEINWILNKNIFTFLEISSLIRPISISYLIFSLLFKD